MTADYDLPRTCLEKVKAGAIVFHCGIGGLAVIRALGRKGVPVVAVDYNRKAVGLSSKYACESIIAPNPEVDGNKFLSFVLENSDKWAGSLLVPAHDAALAIFSYHKKELSRHYILPFPEWEVISKILDKKKTYTVADRLNIPTPNTIYLDEVESLDSLQNNIYPCLLKPRISYEFVTRFHRKAFIIEDSKQLKARIADIGNVGCEMMIQEFISGKDDQLYLYNAYYDADSKPLAEFTKRKLRQQPPILGVGRVVESTTTEEIIDLSRLILRELSFVGLCGVEYKKDPKDGKFKLLEINGRSFQSIGLPIACGIDFPWIMYSDLVLNKKIHLSEYKTGVTWIDEIADISYVISHPIRERSLTKGYFSPYFKPKTLAVFARDDWRPAIKVCYLMLRFVLTKLVSLCTLVVSKILKKSKE